MGRAVGADGGLLNDLLTALKNPERALDFSLRRWDALLPVARRSNLLGRLASLMARRGLLDRVPFPVRRHLEAAVRVAEAHRRAVLWEADRLRWALKAVEVPLVLLKGAAYCAEGLDASVGRLSSDVDLLVPRDALKTVEKALLAHGWTPVKDLPYDQRYYRQWMHELPPLRHRDRGSVVDVHHHLVPLTGRLRPDVRLLWDRVRPSRLEGYFVLCPEDLLIHNHLHAFQDGPVWGALRDVVDADSLLRSWAEEEEAFWWRFVERVGVLGAARPCFYALWAVRALMESQVPPWVLDRLAREGAISPMTKAIMTRAVKKALQGAAEGGGGATTALSRALLFLRSHWLRMPPALLAKHALHKIAVSFRPSWGSGFRRSEN